jgi:hypothetical protein
MESRGRLAIGRTALQQELRVACSSGDFQSPSNPPAFEPVVSVLQYKTKAPVTPTVAM